MRWLFVAAALLVCRPVCADTVGIVSDMWAGDARMAMDLIAVATPQHHVLWMGGAGSLQNLQDILHTRGVDGGIMLTDTLEYARQHHAVPSVELTRIRYIAKLWQEEVHVLARPNIKALPDLDGKHVNVDVVGSSSWMTADLIFHKLGIHPTIETRPQGEALGALRDGKIDALLQVGGAPVVLLTWLPDDSGLHFVPIPDVAGLDAIYAPSVLTPAEYPHLVHEDIPTLSIGAVLAVYGWPTGSERYRAVAAFTRDLYGHIGDIQKPPSHPKWRDVNLAAAVPGWTRSPVADEMIRDRFFHDEEQAGVRPTRTMMERLWRDYLLWRDAAKGH